MKKLTAFLLILSLSIGLISYPTDAATSTSISIVIDGKTEQFEIAPENVNGSILVPMRAIFEVFEATVKWDEHTKQITATKDNTVLVLTIGSKTALINGSELILNTPPQLLNGNTMVPLRIVGEALNSDVEWLSNTSTVVIQSKVYQEIEIPNEAAKIEESLTNKFNAIYIKDIETYLSYEAYVDEKVRKEIEDWFKRFDYIYMLDSFKLTSVVDHEATAEINVIVKQIESFNGVKFASSILKFNFQATMIKEDNIWKSVRFDEISPMQQLPNPNPEDF